MSDRRYMTKSRLDELHGALSDRDRAILTTLGRVRLATGEQLQRLHFHDLAPTSAPRVRRRVLQRLTELRLTARLDRRIGGIRAGSSGYVYCLDVAGQRLLLGHGIAGGRPRKPWTPSRHFVEHRLGITEIYVTLAEHQRITGALIVASFETEPDCWRIHTGLGGARRTLKPDAAVVLHHGQWEERIFLEHDRGTEGPGQITRQLDAYWHYYQTGIEQRDHGVFPRVLWTVPDRDRVAWFVEVASRQPPDRWRLHQVTTEADLIAAILNDQPEATKGPHP
jgi:hypothetical protein